MSIKDGSYSDDPADSDKDQVRFLIGDTCEPFLLSDKEINFLVASKPNVLEAAIEACLVISGIFAQQVDKSIGSLSISLSQKCEKFRTRAADLNKQLLSDGYAEIFVGGRTISGKQSLDQQEDDVQPHTRIGQDDHPGLPDDGHFGHGHNH